LSGCLLTHAHLIATASAVDGSTSSCTSCGAARPGMACLVFIAASYRSARICRYHNVPMSHRVHRQPGRLFKE
jgi:hypothetical protein